VTPESLPDPIAVATAVAERLDRLGITYVIGGSFASSLHGEPRSTNDVDLVADLQTDTVDAFVGSFGAEYYASAAAAVDAVRSGGSFNIVHIPSAVKVDIFVAGADALDRERLQRRRAVRIAAGAGHVELFVDTAENTILRKLEWFRRGGESSERQWRDVIGVVRIRRPDLDHPYLRHWAVRLGVTDLLDRAFDEALREK
jgi:hypothetical protein